MKEIQYRPSCVCYFIYLLMYAYIQLATRETSGHYFIFYLILVYICY
jgi:hypothetical protein